MAEKKKAEKKTTAVGKVAKPAKERRKKEKGAKVEQKSYVVPLRSVYNAPRQKRANRAVTAIKRFMAKHLRALPENVLISNSLNEFIWSKGREHIPGKVVVKVVVADEKVNVYLSDEKIEKKEKPKKVKEVKAEEKEEEKEKLTESEEAAREELEKKKREKKMKEVAAEKSAIKKGAKR